MQWLNLLILVLVVLQSVEAKYGSKGKGHKHGSFKRWNRIETFKRRHGRHNGWYEEKPIGHHGASAVGYDEEFMTEESEESPNELNDWNDGSAGGDNNENGEELALQQNGNKIKEQNGLATKVTKIINGKPLDISNAPYCVRLFVKYSGNMRLTCGGSLVKERVVLTASHCTIGKKASSLAVTAGSHILNQGVSKNVSQIIQHPKYNPNTKDSDIALLVLESTFTLNVNIQLIQIATNPAPENAKVQVSGWGVRSQGASSVSNVLMTVEVTLVKQTTCRRVYSSLTSNMICAGLNENKDSCQGDSGGPLVWNNTQIGVVSFGTGCALPGYPGVYANTAAPSLNAFITKTLSQY